MLALEIDQQTLRVAIGQAANRQFRVTDVFELERSADDGATGAALAEQLRLRQINKTDGIAVVNRWQAELRELTVPPAPDAELPDLVRFQARNEFLSLTDDWPLDFIRLGTSGDNENAPQRVLAAAISPEQIKQLKTISQAANVTLKHIVLQSLALIDLLSETLGSASDRAHLLVQPNATQADLAVAANGQLVSTRTIRFADDATPDKRSRALISEARRTLASAKSLSKTTVTDVLIVGDAKRYKNVTGDLHQRLGLTIDFVEPFQLVPIASNLQTPDNRHSYAALLGALAQHHSPARHAIDFLSPRQNVTLRPDRKRWYIGAAFALATSLLLIFFGWRGLRNQANEIGRLTEELSVVTENAAGNDNRPSVEQIMGEVGAIDQWKLDDINWLLELKEFSDRMLTPDDAIIDNLTAAVGRSQPRFDLASRVASVEKETELLDSLDGRPYLVVPERSVEDDSDKDYPLALDFQATFTPDMNELIRRVNTQANEFLQKQHESPQPESP